MVEAIHDTQNLRIFKISEVRHREEWAFSGRWKFGIVVIDTSFESKLLFFLYSS